MAGIAFDGSWAEGVRVDERRLQEYLCQKQHSVTLKGAAASMKHTLEPRTTTSADDGFVHLGDALMLRSHLTEGLLQADISGSAGVTVVAPGAASLSTGRMLAPCPRNVLSISRVDDHDGFGDSRFVHYGQTIRLSSVPELSESQLYLFATGKSAAGLFGKESLLCLGPRAASGSHWQVLRSAGPSSATSPSLVGVDGADDQCVRLGDAVLLRSVATGHQLMADRTLCMNHYGNEWRVFGHAPRTQDHDANGLEVDPSESWWSFVDSAWADAVVREAREAEDRRLVEVRGLGPGFGSQGAEAGALVLARNAGTSGTGMPTTLTRDPGELLQNPVALAEYELAVLEHQVADAKVVLRVYPLLRRSGIHAVRKLRRMCVSADMEQTGEVSARTFEGLLSYVGVRLKPGELDKLVKLFDVGKSPPTLSYLAFFRLMEKKMPQLREGVVRDAYRKLQAFAAGGVVEIPDLQRHWNPRSHPEFQQGSVSTVEAYEDFMRQWEVASADGIVTAEEFMDYYRDVSMAVEDTELFVEIVRAGWDL